MQTNPAFTLFSLTNPLVASDGQEVVAYRTKIDGKECIAVRKKSDLRWYQRFFRFFHLKDFRDSTIKRLIKEALGHVDVVKGCLKNKDDRDRFKDWYRDVEFRLKRVHVEDGDDDKIQKINDKIDSKMKVLFKEDAPSGTLPQQPRVVAPVPQNPLAARTKEEAALLRPVDPTKVRGIHNQGNWCYLDSFVQAVNASGRFKHMLESRLQGVDAICAALEEEKKDLESKIPLPLRDNVEKSLELARKIEELEKKHADKELRELSLPEGVTQDLLKGAKEHLEKFVRIKRKIEEIKNAQTRAQALLDLCKGLHQPNIQKKYPALGDDPTLNAFVCSFETAAQSFFRGLCEHIQQDVPELWAQLAVDDLLTEAPVVFEEIQDREKENVSGDKSSTKVEPECLFIPSIDTQRKDPGSAVHIEMPKVAPIDFSLQQFFMKRSDHGLSDYVPLKGELDAIIGNERNKSFFSGEEGKVRAQEFREEISRLDTLIPVEKKKVLVGEAPPCLPILVGRYGYEGSHGKKEHSPLKIPFRLEVPYGDPAKDPAVYLLRSVVVHEGELNGGHYTAYAPDLTSIDATTGEPTRYAFMNDASVSSVPSATAMKAIDTNGYVLFYDRVDDLVAQ